MAKLNSPKSLKSRLILYLLIITIVPSIIISYFYYKTSQYYLKENMINTSISNLVYSMDVIDKQLNYAGQLSDWIFLNKNLDSILTRNCDGQKIIYNSEIRTFFDLIDYQLKFNASIGLYISSLFINGKNGVDLREGNDASLIDKTKIEKLEWFKKGLGQMGKSWYGIVANPASIKYDSYILPLVRPIIHSYTNREIGWQMIGFRTAVISDLFRNYEIKNDEALMVIDSQGFCVYNNNNKYIGQDLKKLVYIRTILKRRKEGNLSVRINGATRMVAFAKSELTNWSIIKILSSEELDRQQRMLFNITLIILFFSFIFTSFLTIYLSSNLTHPLTKLLEQTKAIAAGNFSRDPSIEGEDELGILGRGINEMAVNIHSLLDQVIKDEQEKRRLELKMLQYQVNPHFLYNTLNSVKLMATVQKADGIKEMVTALGRLIMNLSKNSSEKITLAEEISLLNDYVYIQNIRYKGKIKLEYNLEREDLRKCKIIKFTLQPIVENAIFHGIEPKKDAGRIAIQILESEGHLLICVEDDGVGMTEEQIDSVLSTIPADKSRGLSGIGIKNVDERMKLTYGSEFGLSIESITGEYTKVKLKIPQEE
jgi:two-component system, sensor histidine kinase YesM